MDQRVRLGRALGRPTRVRGLCACITGEHGVPLEIPGMALGWASEELLHAKYFDRIA